MGWKIIVDSDGCEYKTWTSVGPECVLQEPFDELKPWGKCTKETCPKKQEEPK